MTDNGIMTRTHLLILNAGGIRSLIATALMLARHDKPRITALYLNDGRDNAPARREFAKRQVDHFNLGRLHELELPQLYGLDLGHGHGGEAVGPLAVSQMLLAALAYARANQAERVIWPGCFNAEHAAIAKATEQMTLCQHLAEAEGVPMPELESTLIELSDQQVVELGAQLQVPWDLAWSCTTNPDKSCASCTACRRRKAAFDKAGIVDRPPEMAGPAFAGLSGRRSSGR